MTRREFAIRAATLASLVSLPACLFSNIYKNINQYVPVALLAFDRIVAILVEYGIASAIPSLRDAIDKVKAALADILSAVLEYHEAHEKATMIQAISIALKIAAHRLVEFWELLKIPNEQLAHNIKSLLDVIISTLTAFINQLSPGTPVASQRFLSEPKLRSIREFKQDFNAILSANGLSKYAI